MYGGRAFALIFNAWKLLLGQGTVGKRRTSAFQRLRPSKLTLRR